MVGSQSELALLGGIRVCASLALSTSFFFSRVPQAKEAKRLKEFLEDYDDDRDDPKYYRCRPALLLWSIEHKS